MSRSKSNNRPIGRSNRAVNVFCKLRQWFSLKKCSQRRGSKGERRKSDGHSLLRNLK